MKFTKQEIFRVIHNLKVFFIIYYYIIYNNEIVFFNSNDASTISSGRRLFIVYKQHTRTNETYLNSVLPCCRYIFIHEITYVQR